MKRRTFIAARGGVALLDARFNVVYFVTGHFGSPIGYHKARIRSFRAVRCKRTGLD
jgi:hypothetical protein